MAGPVKGQWGGEDIVLNDAATETTLLAILDAMKRLDKNQGGGTSGGSNATKQVQELGKNFKASGGDVKKAAVDMAISMNPLTSAFSNAYGAVKGLGEELLIGGDRLSDFTQHITGAVSQIPIFGTAVGGLTQLFVGVLDNQIDVFRNLSSAGVDFGGSLFDIQHAATKANLSLGTYQQVVTTNSESLALLGGNATKGARVFTQVSNIVQQSGERFAALGMTMEETAQYTADYLELQTRLGRAQRMDQAQLAAGAEAYIDQLDQLAKVSGKQRDQIAQEMKQQAMDKRLKAMFAGMDSAQATQLQGMLSLIEGASPDIAEATRELMATGGVPVSDFAQSMQRMNPRLGEMAAGLMNGTVSQQEYIAEVRRTGAMMDNMGDAQRRQIGVLEATGNSALAAQGAFIGLGKFGEGMDEAAQAQQDAANRGSAGLLAFQRNLQTLRNLIVGKILDSGIFQSMENGFSGLIDSIMGIDFKATLGPIIDSLTEGVKQVGAVIGTFIDDIKNPDMSFSEALAAAWEKIRPEVVKGFNTIMDFLSPVFASIAEKLIPVLANAAKGALKNFWPEILVAGLAVIAGPAALKALGAMVVKTLVPMLLKAVVALVGGPITITLGLLAAGIIAIFGWDKVKSFFKDPIESIKAMGKAIADFFTWERVSGMFSTAIDAISFVPNQILKIFNIAPVSELMSAAFDRILAIPRKIQELFPAVVEFFQPAVDLIQSVAETIGNLFAPVGEFFRPVTDMILGVADIIQGVIEGIVNFFGNMIDKIPGMGLVKGAFGAVRGFFGRGEEEAKAQEQKVVETSRRTLEGEEKIAFLKEANARDREKLENEEDGGKRVRLRRTIKNRERSIAAEERALASQEQGTPQTPQGSGATTQDPNFDKDRMANQGPNLDKMLALQSAMGNDVKDRMANQGPSGDRQLALQSAMGNDVKDRMAKIKQEGPRLQKVDADELSSYNREITRSLEEIKTQTGGGATVTNRDGTQTRIPGEDSISTKEQMELLNTNLSQLLAAAQEGNRLSGKQYQTLKQNTDSMW